MIFLTLYLPIIVFGLCIIGLPLGFLVQEWLFERELKKEGILPPDW